MICQYGKHFNMHFHDRKDRDSGVDYQCYTSVNRGSPTERKKEAYQLRTPVIHHSFQAGKWK